MRFIISRTSQWSDSDTPPCPEAVQADVETYGYYTFRSVADAKAKYPNREFEKTTDGVRTIGKTERLWVVDIETIDDLLRLYQKYGALVIQPFYRNHKLVEIEIYDDYRE